MVSVAKARFVRISPRKVRYVIDHIRGKDVFQAITILSGAPRRASVIIRKLLDSAVDAAEKNSHLHAQDLYVSKVMADGGPTMKRFRAMSMGRAGVIRKRMSHICLELDIKKNVTPKAPATSAKGQAKKAPVKAVGKKLVGAK